MTLCTCIVDISKPHSHSVYQGLRSSWGSGQTRLFSVIFGLQTVYTNGGILSCFTDSYAHIGVDVKFNNIKKKSANLFKKLSVLLEKIQTGKMNGSICQFDAMNLRFASSRSFW